VSGGISHVAMQLDVQRESAMQSYKYPAVGVVQRPTPANSGSLSRSPQYGVFICIWLANPKITDLRAGETATGVC